MKTEKIAVFAGMLVIILLGFLIIWNADILGSSPENLERKAREEQEIDSQWELVQDTNADMSALLFYNRDKSDCRFSVYLTREGLSYGYFFREGGADGFIISGVRGLVFEDKGVALLSLNVDKVCKIQCSNGESREIDPSMPFAVVLPADCGEVTLYDETGRVVTLYDAF